MEESSSAKNENVEFGEPEAETVDLSNNNSKPIPSTTIYNISSYTVNLL